MKQIVILICSFLSAFIIVEFIVVLGTGYPNLVTGVRTFSVHTGLGRFNDIAWYPPFYKFWTIEGGYKSYHMNNLGLTGSDVENNLKNILVLGTSYIEALQVPNTETATAVFANLLHPLHKYNVINIALSGVDPYVSWFRLDFYRRWFMPDFVILIIDPTCMTNFNQKWNAQLDFSSPYQNPKQWPVSRNKKLINQLRAHSSFLNLAGIIVQPAPKRGQKVDPFDISSCDTEVFYSKFEQCISQYAQSYPDNFIVISIIHDKRINSNLSVICQKRLCSFAGFDSLLVSRNLIHGKGHLTTKGNQMLGEYMYHNFMQVFESIR